MADKNVTNKTKREYVSYNVPANIDPKVNGTKFENGSVIAPSQIEPNGWASESSQDSQFIYSLLTKNNVTHYELTVTFHILITGSPTNTTRVIFHKGTSDSTKTPSMFLGAYNNKPTFRCTTSYSSSDGFECPFEIPMNQWTHIAWVLYGRFFGVFKDGVLEHIHSTTGNVTINSGPLYIGKTPWLSSFQGSIKGFRIYNKALSTSQIFEDMNSEEPIDHFNQSIHRLKQPLTERTGLGPDLKRYINNPLGSDLKIIVGDKSVYAHQCILRCRSKYFDTMLKSGMKESGKNSELRLSEVPYDLFIMLLEYMYTGEIENSDSYDFSTIMKLFAIADRFMCTDMDNLCLERLEQLMNVDNVCDIYVTAYDMKSGKLQQYCKKFIVKNIGPVMKSDKFVQLPEPLMKSVLREATLLLNL